MSFSGKGAEVSVEVGRSALAWCRGRFHIQKGCFCHLQSRSEVSEFFSAVEMVNLMLNSADSFKVASRQKSTNLHICRFLSGVLDGTLDLEKFTFGERWTFCFETILPSLKYLEKFAGWFDLCLVVLSAASYYAAGHLSYIKILARLQGLGE